MTRARTVALVAVTYAVASAVGLGWLLLGPGSRWLLLDSLVADLLATLVIFGVSRTMRNSSFYDAWWSVAPPLLVLYWWLVREEGTDDWRAALLGIVIAVWAVRLTGNWIRGYPGHPHEDWRYDLLRSRAPRFELVIDLMAIHVIPTIQVFAALIPAYVAVAVGTRPLGWLDGVAFVIGAAAIALETRADRELRTFARRRRPGEILATGLWGWSRHPNYFGELCVWISVALFGIAASPGDWWLPIGVVMMLAMFQGASIPMMEERSLARRPDYQRVIDTVPRLVPRPRRRPRHADTSPRDAAVSGGRPPRGS